MGGRAEEHHVISSRQSSSEDVDLFRPCCILKPHPPLTHHTRDHGTTDVECNVVLAIDTVYTHH
jgi:hypothetical protein